MRCKVTEYIHWPRPAAGSVAVTCLWYGFKFYISAVAWLQAATSHLWSLLDNVSSDGNSDAGAKRCSGNVVQASMQGEFLAGLSLMDGDCRFLGYLGEEFNLFSIILQCSPCARHRCMTAAGQHKYCKHFLQPEHKFSRARNLREWLCGADTSGRAQAACSTAALQDRGHVSPAAARSKYPAQPSSLGTGYLLLVKSFK